MYEMLKLDAVLGLFWFALFILLNSQICNAVWPQFSSPLTPEQAAPCLKAFADAVVLARHTALFFDPCTAPNDSVRSPCMKNAKIPEEGGVATNRHR